MHINVYIERAVCMFLYIQLVFAGKHYYGRSQLDGNVFVGDLFTTNTLTLIECMVMCTNNKTCVAAIYTPDGTCVGYPIWGSGQLAIGAVGAKYYHAACDSTWEWFEGSCYRFGPLEKSWADAKAFCEERGAMLAEVKSSSEHNYVADKLRTLAYQGLVTWIGGDHLSGSWKWASSQESINDFPSFWAPNEPNAPNVEQCVGMNKRHNYRWHDIGCDFTAPFVCEIDYY